MIYGLLEVLRRCMVSHAMAVPMQADGNNSSTVAFSTVGKTHLADNIPATFRTALDNELRKLGPSSMLGEMLSGRATFP